MEENNKQVSVLKKYGAAIWEMAKIAILAFVIVAPIRYFLFQPFLVSGASMAPSFATGDYLIIDEISYRFAGPQRGDVVVFKADFLPNYEKQRFIKRIIGVPGETVDIKNGEVNIIKDGQKIVLEEEYLAENIKTYGDKNITLGGDEYFVLGDNREYSYDSRMWGVVRKKDIIGKAFLRIFPITSFASIARPAYQ